MILSTLQNFYEFTFLNFCLSQGQLHFKFFLKLEHVLLKLLQTLYE